MNKYIVHLSLIVLLVFGSHTLSVYSAGKKKHSSEGYWISLDRFENREYLYFGIPGARKSSRLVMAFLVKSGMPGARPTPLPEHVGKNYWTITRKYAVPYPSETAPYFLTLDVPYTEDPPFGPIPYLECGGLQCDWVVPGEFGLHGTGGDETRLSHNDPGSSGCVRHRDVDILYLYTILQPETQEIRYYIHDRSSRQLHGIYDFLTDDSQVF